MTAGRTTWSARDAAHHDRELVVELLDEFGPAGPYVETVLRDLAQQQRDSGAVRTGFRVLEKKCGITRDQVRTIVQYGAGIGIFDDLAIDEDGRRFTLRVSGWDADQQRGRGAVRQENSRTRHDEGDAVTENVTEPDAEPERNGHPRVTFRRRPVPPTRVTLAERILDDFNQQAGTKFGAYTGDDRPSDALKRIIGAVTDHPDLDAARAHRLTEHALKRPWWEGPPSVGVVFGPGVIERNLAAANGQGVRNLTSAELAGALSRDRSAA